MATHSSILAWKIPWTEEPGGLNSPWVCKESDTTEHAHMQQNSRNQERNVVAATCLRTNTGKDMCLSITWELCLLQAVTQGNEKHSICEAGHLTPQFKLSNVSSSNYCKI